MSGYVKKKLQICGYWAVNRPETGVNLRKQLVLFGRSKIHNFWCRDSLMIYLSIGFGISQFRVVWTKL